MRTKYVFSVDTAELVYTRQSEYGQVLTVNHRDEFGVQQLVEMFVSEGVDAKREMFNYFGDDSSWPPGWWDKIGRPSSQGFALDRWSSQGNRGQRKTTHRQRCPGKNTSA